MLEALTPSWCWWLVLALVPALHVPSGNTRRECVARQRAFLGRCMKTGL